MSYSAGDVKWGEPTLGTSSGTVTWAADYTDGLTMAAGFDSADFDTALSDAFNAWEVVASVDFEMVSWGSEPDITLATGALSGGAAGTAQITFGGNAGLSEIFSGAITFADNLTWSPYGGSGGVDFYAVALHEIGHVIGLEHVDDRSEIMNPVIFADNLGDGDIAGAQFLYGTDSGDAETPPVSAPDDPAPEPLAVEATGGDGGGGGAIGLLLGLIAALIGIFVGGGSGAGIALVAGHVPDEDEDDEEMGETHLSQVFVPELPLPAIAVEDLPGQIGCEHEEHPAEFLF